MPIRIRAMKMKKIKRDRWALKIRSALRESASSAAARDEPLPIKSRVDNGYNVALAPLADEPSALRLKNFL